MPCIYRVTAEQFLEQGLEAVGFSMARQQQTRAATRCFHASFGAGPGAAVPFIEIRKQLILQMLAKPNPAATIFE